MPSRAIPSNTISGHMGIHFLSQESSISWTDDLPVCHLSGVGLSHNQIYREDGQRREEHEFEDRSFHFKLAEDTFFYGVFDGHEGSRAADFVAQHMPAEVLLGQLSNKTTDRDVKEVLHQAFTVMEKGFFESIGDLLAEKATLQLDLPEGISSYETCKQYPDVAKKLQELCVQVSGGTTAVVALIYNNRLYVANVGDSRALLVRIDKDDVLKVIPISVDHDLRNEDELLRLSQLNLDVEKIRKSMSSKLENQYNTRCIGNYMVKGGYKDFESLREATKEPVIAEPEVYGGIAVDDSFSFLILMSDGLYKALEEATGTENANVDIARMVAEQFKEQSTLVGVAQAVVDKVVRFHHDSFVSGNSSYQKRDDITLLVRNFNCPMPRALGSPQQRGRVQFNPQVSTEPEIRYIVPANNLDHFRTEQSTSTESSSNTEMATSEESKTEVSSTTAQRSSNTTSTDSDDRMFNRQNNQLPLDEDGRIEPYIDFSDYYKAIEEEKANACAAEPNGFNLSG